MTDDIMHCLISGPQTLLGIPANFHDFILLVPLLNFSTNLPYLQETFKENDAKIINLLVSRIPGSKFLQAFAGVSWVNFSVNTFHKDIMPVTLQTHNLKMSPAS